MDRPTKEEYENACKDIVRFSDWIASGTNKINRLLDSIYSERENIRSYEERIKELSKVKMLYEKYLDTWYVTEKKW